MGAPRILCGIYTNAGSKSIHDPDGTKDRPDFGAHRRWPLQQSVMQTWGKRCDKVRDHCSHLQCPPTIMALTSHKPALLRSCSSATRR
jgi:hypothetical protein